MLAENICEISDITGDEHHFWVTNGPLFSTTLFCIPPKNFDKSHVAAVLKFYDPDGYLFNEAKVEFLVNQIGFLELANFMEACKIHNGIKHAHLFITNDVGASFTIRAGLNGNVPMILSEPSLLSKTNASCFPMLFAPNKRTFISVINHSKTIGKFRCKLIADKRSPEVVHEVPPLGAVLINTEVEFPQFFSRERALPAYVRLSAVGDTVMGVTCFEESRGESGINTYVGMN
ncbi:MAG: hypothetical protein KDD56_00190 [Bdellovibrionales bacterium]|nr:hypothetical protein [Bdellovibrionales bacterium]